MNLQTLLELLAVLTILFCLLRELWCWYFKFTRMVRALESIELTQLMVRQAMIEQAERRFSELRRTS